MKLINEAFYDARDALTHPRDFFGRKPEAESWSAPAARLAFWSFSAGLIDTAVVIFGWTDRPGSPLLNVVSPFFFPVFGLAFGAVAALVLHTAWKVLGGKAPLAASWRAAAAVSFTMPLDVLTADLGFFGLVPGLLRYALLGVAGEGVHGLTRGRAWGLAGLLAALDLLAKALS